MAKGRSGGGAAGGGAVAIIEPTPVENIVREHQRLLGSLDMMDLGRSNLSEQNQVRIAKELAATRLPTQTIFRWGVDSQRAATAIEGVRLNADQRIRQRGHETRRNITQMAVQQRDRQAQTLINQRRRLIQQQDRVIANANARGTTPGQRQRLIAQNDRIVNRVNNLDNRIRNIHRDGTFPAASQWGTIDMRQVVAGMRGPLRTPTPTPAAPQGPRVGRRTIT